MQAETDPTVPAWAKAETKPTYTAAEIGAATAAQGELAESALQEIPTATATAVGGIKAALKSDIETQEIKIGEDGKLYAKDAVLAPPNIQYLVPPDDFDVYPDGHYQNQEDTSGQLHIGGGDYWIINDTVNQIALKPKAWSVLDAKESVGLYYLRIFIDTYDTRAYSDMKKVFTKIISIADLSAWANTQSVYLEHDEYNFVASDDATYTMKINYSFNISDKKLYINTTLSGSGKMPPPADYSIAAFCMARIIGVGMNGEDGKDGRNGVNGKDGKNSALEAVTVAPADFASGAVTIYPDTEAYAEQTLKHHILAANGSGTGYIVAFKRVGDSNVPITASVTADGVVTITTDAFDGEILLSSGSAYKYAGGGGSAEHVVLAEGEDYTFDDGTGEGSAIGIPTITFTETADVPLYAAHIRGRMTKSGESDIPVAANFTLKKVPFEATIPIDEEDPPTTMSYGICDEKFFAPFGGGDLTSLNILSIIYFNLNGVERWGYMLSGLSIDGYSFIQDAIEIIKI
ncbi:MAG: hypothetical protein LBP79_06085 [Clostridiales bacterium]|nr:hypothetical protein [Clostridiales bacterium]